MKHRKENGISCAYRGRGVSAARFTLALVGIATLSAFGAGSESGFELTRATIDGGGAMRSAGGKFQLSGTIGQCDAGRLVSGAFELSGGFWFPLVAGDHDEDGLVGLLDFGAFEQCMTGPNHGPPEVGCDVFDTDRSRAIDLADFATIQKTFTGG